MKLIIEVNKEDLDFLRKTFTQNSHDYIPMVIKNRFTDAVLNGTPIPDNATNGDVIKVMFPNAKIVKTDKEVFLYTGTREKDKDIQIFDTDWWNEPYQKGGK